MARKDYQFKKTGQGLSLYLKYVRILPTIATTSRLIWKFLKREARKTKQVLNQKFQNIIVTNNCRKNTPTLRGAYNRKKKSHLNIGPSVFFGASNHWKNYSVHLILSFGRRRGGGGLILKKGRKGLLSKFCDIL